MSIMKIGEPKNLEQAARALKSIAHPARLKILALLGCRARMSVSELQSMSGLTQSMTSQHLAAMKRSGILASEREKNRIFYCISNKEVLKVIGCMNKCGDSRA